MRWILMVVVTSAILGGCAKHRAPAEGSQPVEVSVMVVTPRNTPIPCRTQPGGATSQSLYQHGRHLQNNGQRLGR